MDNPLRYVDPNGEDIWDVVEGFGNGLSSAFTFNMTRVDASSRNQEYQTGQIVGDVAAAVTGAAVTAVGLGGTGAGVAVSGTGVGAVAGVPAAVASGAVAAAGLTATTTAVRNATSSTANLIFKEGTQDHKLSKAEIKDLERSTGRRAEQMKKDILGSKAKVAHYDIYRTREGSYVVKPKGGEGPGEPLGITGRTTGIDLHAIQRKK